MFDFFGNLFDASFMSHGHCYMWQPEILWLHVLSDAMTALAYFTIPAALIYFVYQRRDVVFKWIFVLFGAFILLCGATHALEIITVWQGMYRLTGLVKLATGLVSIGTAIAIWPLIPQALVLPSPKQYKEANEALRHEIEERKRVEKQLKVHQETLETTIQERTRELEEANLRIRLLVSVASRTGNTLDEQIENILRISAEVLGIDAGLLCKMQDVSATVVSAYTPDGSIEVGQTFELETAFYDVAVSSRDVVAISDTAELSLDLAVDLLPFHPASCITAPMFSEQELFGVLYFFSKEKKEPAFSSLDLDFVRVLSKWVTWVLELQKGEIALKRYAQELSRSNQELDNFAYVASHDLKAPLRAIENLAFWIEEDSGDILSADSKQHLDQLHQRVTRMEKLLDDLLKYSRAGSMKSDIVRIDTAEMLQDLIDLLSPPKSFTIELHEPLPVITSEHSPLFQVFYNLIGNAIKHHDRPDGRIDIRSRDRGTHVEFDVTDDGPGIPEEYHERIFELFQTLQPRDKVEGSGMGLAIIQKLLWHHGGEIKLYSRAGAGSTFTFTWPKEASEPADEVLSKIPGMAENLHTDLKQTF